MNQRNGEKSAAWNQAVTAHIIATFYPGDVTEYERIWPAIRTEDKWLPFVSDAEKSAHALRKQTANACCQAITTALSSKKYDPIPRPTFEATPLRHMATHLIWHVRELNLDREPLTTDKL